MNALRRIHAALVTGGLLVDTQPISPRPPVETEEGELGTLDMREWRELIETIDRRVEKTVEDGLWALRAERRFVVTDTFESGRELVDVVTDWQGTTIPDALTARLARTTGPARVHQEIRLRLLEALK